MDLIEEISGYIDNNSGLFVFGFLNYMDEIIVDAMINDILLKIKKPLTIINSPVFLLIFLLQQDRILLLFVSLSDDAILTES